jgi:hypothetical protein
MMSSSPATNDQRFVWSMGPELVVVGGLVVKRKKIDLRFVSLSGYFVPSSGLGEAFFTSLQHLSSRVSFSFQLKKKVA